MFGFVIGTVCLVGLVGVARGGRHCGPRGFHGHHGRWERGYDGGGRGRRGGRRGRGGFARAAGEVFKRRVGVDEDQADIVDHAMRDLRDSLKELGESVRDSRADLVGAFTGEEVDEAAIAAVWARHDEELARTRREAVSALKQIHSVLDPEQRSVATDWLGTIDTAWGA